MNERAPSTGDRDTRLLNPLVAAAIGWAALVSLVLLGLFGLWGAPPDAVQGDAQRLMYLHVPTAWLAYLAFFVTAVASALYLWPRTRARTWDRLAGVSAELGVIFTGLTLLLGSLWGRAGLGCVVGVGRPVGDDGRPLLPVPRVPRSPTDVG